MGNCLGRRKVVQQYWEHEQPKSQPWKDRIGRSLNQAAGSSLRIKVRMTTKELKELMAQVDMSKGDTELGGLIMQECFIGRCDARVVAGRDWVSEYAKGGNLSTITEEENGCL